jgi:hypothetical protein
MCSEKSSLSLPVAPHTGEPDLPQTPLCQGLEHCSRGTVEDICILSSPVSTFRCNLEQAMADVRYMQQDLHTWHLYWLCHYYISDRHHQHHHLIFLFIWSLDNYDPLFRVLKDYAETLPLNFSSHHRNM